MIIAIMVDMFGTLLTGLGLRSTDPNKKYKYYRVAIYALIVASKYKRHALTFSWSHIFKLKCLSKTILEFIY